MKVSALMIAPEASPEDQYTYATYLQDANIHRFWFGQSGFRDPFGSATYLGGRGIEVPFGFAVSIMPLQTSYSVAAQASTVSERTGSPTILGIGPGSAASQRALLKGTYSKPVFETQKYLHEVRTHMSGEVLGTANVELGLGVLRPEMARLAGREQSHAITWMCPPNYIRDTLNPAIASGREENRASAARLIAICTVIKRRPARNELELVELSHGAHISAPHYVDMLKKSGLADQSSRRQILSYLLDSGAAMTGSAAELHAIAEMYRACGVDELVLNMTAVAKTSGLLQATREIAQVAEAFHDLG